MDSTREAKGSKRRKPSAGPVAARAADASAERLDLVQRRTFGYFWDFAHLTSGFARDRNNPTHPLS
jgi:hypothetical protein